RLLEDAEACPPAMRDFTWGLYYRLCRRQRGSLGGHGEQIRSLAFSEDGKVLASGSETVASKEKPMAGEIKLWDVDSRAGLATLRGHRGGVGALCFAPGGHVRASGSDDGSVILWALARRRPLATLPAHEVSVNRLSFTADGMTLLSMD